jgi:hypothetical protein
MDLDGNKRVCGICLNWQGKREGIDGGVRVKSSAKGQCAILNKIKPVHGGCDQWKKWDGQEK